MVTDRCTTACLLCYLCSAYPHYTVYFQAIISVDLASHYMHMYRLLSPGDKPFSSLVLSIKGSHHIKRYQKNKVGYCDNTTAIMSSSLYSAHATNFSSSRFTSSLSLPHQTLLHV